MVPFRLLLNNQIDKLAGKSAVWPFETDFIETPTPKTGPYVVHAEIWPGVVKNAVASRVQNRENTIRDKIQVRLMCRWAADLDRRNELGKLFDTPAGLDRSRIQTCIEHEGWILGA